MNKQQLALKIWKSANKLRSKIEASVVNIKITFLVLFSINFFRIKKSGFFAKMAGKMTISKN